VKYEVPLRPTPEPPVPTQTVPPFRSIGDRSAHRQAHFFIVYFVTPAVAVIVKVSRSNVGVRRTSWRPG
jgi:hypothetical protein